MELPELKKLDLGKKINNSEGNKIGEKGKEIVEKMER